MKVYTCRRCFAKITNFSETLFKWHLMKHHGDKKSVAEEEWKKHLARVSVKKTAKQKEEEAAQRALIANRRQLNATERTLSSKQTNRLSRAKLRVALTAAKKETEKLRRQLVEAKKQIVITGAPRREAHPFYDSKAWRKLRYEAICRYGRSCAVCFRTNVEIHVDHIKPRSKFPELALDISNLQILCRDCNLGKSNRDETDWRGKNVGFYE